MNVITIILIIIGIVILLFSAGMFIFKVIVSVNSKVQKPNEIIIGNGDETKKALMIYQKTRHKSATDIARAIAERLHENGYRVVINHPSEYISYNIEDYDLLVFGSGAYAGNPSGVLKSYMHNIAYAGHDVLVFVVGLVANDNDELKQLLDIAEGAKKVDGIKLSPGGIDRAQQFTDDFLHN